MRQTLRLGRIAGIPVGVNWSLLFIAVLLWTSLAGTVLPLAQPGLSPTAYAVVGLVAAVGFFASILAHEMGHALVAIGRGVPVLEVTLWLLGGVARLGRDAPDARTEIAVAAAGPATSVVLGLVFTSAASGLDAVGWGLAAAAAGWLGSINFLLAVFNLLPAAPLDGGRVLSGVLWAWRGDRDGARLAAARLGRVLGWGLIAVGVAAMFGSGGLALWPVLLGTFVLRAAGAEQEVAEARRHYGGTRVGEIATRVPWPVPSWATVDWLIDHVDVTAPGLVAVVDPSGRTVGVVTAEQLRHVPLEWRSGLTLGELALGLDRFPLVRVDDLVAEVAPVLSGAEVPVVDELGQVVGVAGPRELARFDRSGV